VICKLEAQYWCEEDVQDFSLVPKEELRWKMMIRTPGFVNGKELEKAKNVLLEKGKGREVTRVGLESLAEGRCVQMLHVGPYEKEGETIAVMEEFAADEGFRFHGLHHEIYLSDPRRVPPERLKTILRHPVEKI
jgi:hypothetical protein